MLLWYSVFKSRYHAEWTWLCIIDNDYYVSTGKEFDFKRTLPILLTYSWALNTSLFGTSLSAGNLCSELKVSVGKLTCQFGHAMQMFPCLWKVTINF